MGEDWTTILKGPKGEHLLCLEDGLTEDTLHTNYQFDYVTDDCVEDFSTCRKLAPPVQVPKTTLRTTYRFNERLLSDTIWLQILDKTTPVLTMMDPAVERGWIKVFALFVDSHRAWGSNEVMHYSTDHGIELVVSPGEAHERLAQLERRHQVLRRAVEMYLEDHPPTGPESLVEALSFVVPQLNQTLSVGGFSPTQWVLGYQPNILGSLLDTNVNYSHLGPPNVYWLVQGTALIRAAPEHVRPDLESDTLAADTPALHSLVRKVQNRGTTVYIDLFKTNRKRRREDIAYFGRRGNGRRR
eukprot:s6529_g2.t2